jgi:hypothetical protein
MVSLVAKEVNPQSNSNELRAGSKAGGLRRLAASWARTEVP